VRVLHQRATQWLRALLTLKLVEQVRGDYAVHWVRGDVHHLFAS